MSALFFECVTGSGTSSGVNFAVPIDTVTKVVPQIIVYGTVSRALEAKRERTKIEG